MSASKVSRSPFTVRVASKTPMDEAHLLARDGRTIVARQFVIRGAHTRANFERIARLLNEDEARTVAVGVDALAERLADAQCQPGESLWRFLAESERAPWRAAARAAAAEAAPAALAVLRELVAHLDQGAYAGESFPPGHPMHAARALAAIPPAADA